MMTAQTSFGSCRIYRLTWRNTKYGGRSIEIHLLENDGGVWSDVFEDIYELD